LHIARDTLNLLEDFTGFLHDLRGPDWLMLLKKHSLYFSLDRKLR